MKPNTLYGAVAHFFMLLFVYTTVAKIMDFSAFRLELAVSPIWGSAAGFVALALPLTEILIVVALFLPAWRLRGLYASFLLMALFILYVLGLLFIDDHLSCSCGGVIENLTPRQHLLFNTACIVLALIGIWSGRTKKDDVRQQGGKWWTTSAALFLFVSIGWLTLTAAKTPALEKTGFEGRPLPSIDLVLADSVTHLNTKDIPEGKPFVIVGFSPYCPVCRREIKDILHNMKQFESVHIYLITYFPVTDLKYFYTNFQLAKYPNVTAAVDSGNVFLKNFHQHFIPFTTVYDSKKRLAQVIPGRDIRLLSNCINR